MLNKISLIVLLFILLIACEEEGVRLQLKETVEANEIADLLSSDFVLDREKAVEQFEEFTWSAPDFGFPAAVTYILQIDKQGNNFVAPVEVLTTGSLSASITVGEMNKKLLDLGLETDTKSNVEIRIISKVNDNVEPVYSTSKSFSVTPYATDFPPVYMIGDATGGWDLGKAVEVRSIAPSKYQTTSVFTNGGKFRFFASASWDASLYNWATFEGGTVDPNLISGQDGDSNFKFVGTTGWYKITADTKNKVITMEAVEKPALYMIGAAVQGWDLAKAVELTRLQDGLFKVTTSFTSGETFRFFTKPDWSAGTINYPYFNGGQIDPLFVNANDGDKNFKFTGTTGEYTITVDLNNLTVVMGTGSSAAPIYMIGDATGGWDLAKALKLTSIGTSKYETTAAFTNGGKFRFFVTPAWDAQQYKWSTFEGGTVDTELENGQDGDGNFKVIGATGSYKITVDIQNKSIIMELQ